MCELKGRLLEPEALSSILAMDLKSGFLLEQPQISWAGRCIAQDSNRANSEPVHKDSFVNHGSPTRDLSCALLLAVNRDCRVLISPEALILLISSSSVAVDSSSP